MNIQPLPRKRILVVDDDSHGLDSTRRILEFAGYEVVTASDGKQALDTIRSPEGSGLHAILTDVRMPQMTGLEFLKALTVLSLQIPVILMTAFGTVDDAVWAMKLGAVDFLSKPFKKKQLLEAVSLALSRSHGLSWTGPELRAPAMAALQEQLARVAGTNATVMILGESGVGKERIARDLHARSGRARGPFIAVNCAAIPENLLESELFGFEKGAFSGADHAKPGLFEAAHGGTLLLDEVGDMPLSIQAKLLRVLQEGEVRRLGATRSTKVDVRLLAATHQNLREQVEQGRFRQDLLYRLEVIVFTVPALRERREDVLPLAEYFLKQSCERHGKMVLGFSEEVVRLLGCHDWPGNVRELSNAVERAVVLSVGDRISPEDLPPTVRRSDVTRDPSLSGAISIPLGTALKDVEDLLIRKTLEATDGDKAMTARLLGITSRTIYRKLDRREVALEDVPDA